MKQDRRYFLMGGLFCLPLAVTGTYSFFQESSYKTLTSSSALLLSSVSDRRGQNYAAAVDQSGKMYYKLAIPERAHDSLYNTRKKEVIYFGRSPSTSIYIVDVLNKKMSKVLSADKNRHFCGHGVIDKTNRYLYIVENNTLLNQGCIGIYDAWDNYKKIDEISSYGVGPHQIALLSDDKTLVVANGGIVKDRNNTIINQESFISSLAYISAQESKLLASYPSQFSGNSLRHLTVDGQDQVFVGAQSHSQYINPLVFSHKGEDHLEPFIAEDYIWQGHNNYTASLEVCDDKLVVSSPRGNSLSFWDKKNRRFLTKKSYLDVAGITVGGADSSELLVSTGQGMLLTLNETQLNKRYRAKDIAWDNHLSLAVRL